MQHKFHIPVMGLGFTIDTPLKVARLGISSVVSIVDDILLEDMRRFYTQKMGWEYIPIPAKEADSRARRITAYLNMLNELVSGQVEELRKQPFTGESDLDKYFLLLPDTSALRREYLKMSGAAPAEKKQLEEYLRGQVVAGAIDVNIMTKVDKVNYAPDGSPLPAEYSDALSALRGFAKSDLRSSVVLSAGLNPRLYGYFEEFSYFFPDEEGFPAKKIILKVSDYRSAMIQGKFLAKKGLWVSEFRIESGLNCGGHAFINDGVLLGPIMETFKSQRQPLYNELLTICEAALKGKSRAGFSCPPEQRITVQGGIGSAAENDFLLDYYALDNAGWGSPFLLVPEATNVDQDTLEKLCAARQEDYYLSEASPLGVPFHNFRHSSSEIQRKERIVKNRPGSPCHRKFLSFNNEFTDRPICTASRQYQQLKLEQVKDSVNDDHAQQEAKEQVVVKDCLCEGLAVTALLNNGVPPKSKLKAVVICPGPNLAYFSRLVSLKEMIDHIYGRTNLLAEVFRPNLFVNELRLYIDYLKREVERHAANLTEKKQTYFRTFRENLITGIRYYETLFPQLQLRPQLYPVHMLTAMKEAENELMALDILR